MHSIHQGQTTASTRRPTSEAVQALAGRFRGELIRPTDASYDAARRVRNALVDR